MLERYRILSPYTYQLCPNNVQDRDNLGPAAGKTQFFVKTSNHFVGANRTYVMLVSRNKHTTYNDS